MATIVRRVWRSERARAQHDDLVRGVGAARRMLGRVRPLSSERLLYMQQAQRLEDEAVRFALAHSALQFVRTRDAGKV